MLYSTFSKQEGAKLLVAAIAHILNKKYSYLK